MAKALLTGSRYTMVGNDWWKPRNHGRRVPWTFRESDVTAEYTERQLRLKRHDEVPRPDHWTADDLAMIYEMKLAVANRDQKRFGMSWLQRRFGYSGDTVHRYFAALVETGSARWVGSDTVEIVDAD
jgi:hypothetical protein